MKDLKSTLAEKASNVQFTLERRKTSGFLLVLLVVLGLSLIAVVTTSWFRDSARTATDKAVRQQVSKVVDKLTEVGQSLTQAMTDDQVQKLAIDAIGNPENEQALGKYMSGRVAAIDSARVFAPGLVQLDAAQIGANGYAVVDMLFDAARGANPPLQLHGSLDPKRLVDAVSLRQDDEIVGFLVVTADPAILFSKFDPGDPAAGYLALKQYNGRQSMSDLRILGDPALSGEFPEVVHVPNTLFRVLSPQIESEILMTASQRLSMLLLGILMLAATWYLRKMNAAYAVIKAEEDRKKEAKKALRIAALEQDDGPRDRRSLPAAGSGKGPDSSTGSDTPAIVEAKDEAEAEADNQSSDDMAMQIKAMIGGSGLGTIETPSPKDDDAAVNQHTDSEFETGRPGPGAPTPESSGLVPAKSDSSGSDELAADTSNDPGPPPGRPPAAGQDSVDSDPPRMHLRYDIQERRRMKSSPHDLVELDPSIFRAYDIRGIVGKTLDKGIANQVGQVLGSMVLEKDAGPLVIARDGRLSGSDLVDGMTAGALSSGCEVLDIGAVPTGVLYYAAHELAAGSGVMITGSHNPPDYNGFKVMLAGDTLFGDQITRIYERIMAGDIRVGKGSVSHRDVLDEYRERIASDVKMERPLKVVIDCGNGIGGVCAAEVLRAVGAEVVPMFDEVDGTFPNHHPDPSDPANLRDLIDSVRMMDADLGLALDGDADRLGVVTLGGTIIYPDRVMMLLALDVLDRVPGATIIYDVKCTGHLAKVIEEAGGNAVMYKTGHSLIKARMKEIGSPFAGEMSGHFFFGERWYGVDDGIYAACRLLEILSGTDTPPEAILNALPTSFSTPELKIEMEEGENHEFMAVFQTQARFEGARISTIDGVRADYEDGWGLVRASNTTPILVVRFDAESEQSLERIKTLFRQQLMLLRPDLKLPF